MKLIHVQSPSTEKKQDGRTVGPPTCVLHKGFNQLWIKKYFKKNSRTIQKNKTWIFHVPATICIVVTSTYIDVHALGIISTLKMIYSIQEGVSKLYEYTIPFIQGTWVSVDFGIHGWRGRDSWNKSPRDTKVQPWFRIEVWRIRREVRGEMGGRQQLDNQGMCLAGVFRALLLHQGASCQLAPTSYFSHQTPPISLQ